MTRSRHQQTLKLDAHDAAIIFKKDGTFKLSLPKEKKDQTSDHILTMAAFAYALGDHEMTELIYQKFLSECAQLDIKEKEQKLKRFFSH